VHGTITLVGKSIDDYRDKRDFDRTREPPPDRRPGPRGAPVFVVHRHEARNLHYDLRLEMQGVLRSWAVPRGFSYDPRQKRLAVRTEDHPIAYESFEGLIPPGEYGAGALMIWDHGWWELVHADDAPGAVEAGELKVVLHGRRLRGEWHLVKTKQGAHHWLLFKSRDRYAGPARDSALGVDLSRAVRAPAPARVARMEPGGERAPFTDAAWLFEAEFAGRRLLAEKRGDGVRLRGLGVALPDIERSLGRLRAEDALLDGVLVVTDDGGRPSRAALEARLSGASDATAAFYAFDLLHWDEFDLRPLGQLERKSALRAVLPADAGALLYVDHVLGDGERLADAVGAAGLGGVIAKRADAAYAAGPSPDWRRVRIDAESGQLDVAQALARRRPRRGSARVKLTNLDKVYWPAEGYTKGDLVAYYERVAEVLLPYLFERPVHMHRFPDGIEGKSFYQRHPKEHLPAWVTTLDIEGSEGEDKRHVLCNDRDTLLHLVNAGSIDLHPWLSRRASLASPDWAVLDLDPKDAPFAHVVRIARQVGRILRGIGLRPLLKTSGKTGLHVYVPLAPGYSYAQSRLFCEGVARVVCRELPDVATVERRPTQRGGKVYVDFGQNGRGQTVVPPYVVRPVAGASASTPLEWDELERDLSISMFTLATLPARIEQRGDLFRPALHDRQDLLPAIEALESYIREG
jgi:bifunctional non-homologous end joining protein LigD